MKRFFNCLDRIQLLMREPASHYRALLICAKRLPQYMGDNYSVPLSSSRRNTIRKLIDLLWFYQQDINSRFVSKKTFKRGKKEKIDASIFWALIDFFGEDNVPLLKKWVARYDTCLSSFTEKIIEMIAKDDPIGGRVYIIRTIISRCLFSHDRKEGQKVIKEQWKALKKNKLTWGDIYPLLDITKVPFYFMKKVYEHVFYKCLLVKKKKAFHLCLYNAIKYARTDQEAIKRYGNAVRSRSPFLNV